MTGDTKQQVGRFLIVGVTTVLIDFVAYMFLLWFGMAVSPAKALGFITGMVFAFVANKSWTFSLKSTRKYVILPFILVYGTNLLINVGINDLVIWFFGREKIFLLLAFFCATGTSAVLNFLGMKFIVFSKDLKEAAAPTT